MRGSINSGERTEAWVNGDTLTNRITDAIGAVKWTHPRQSDGKRFLRVRILQGEAAGAEVWENENWILGRGKSQITCMECGYPFRTDDIHASFCPCCARHQRPQHDTHATSFAHDRARLFGNATPYPSPPPKPELTTQEQAAEAERRRREEDTYPF